MKIISTSLPGVLMLEPHRFGDQRGWFSEVWNRETLRTHGIDIDFVQDNHSLSVSIGTVRGLHFQAPPRAQDKLVRCGSGAVFDVAVDVRRGSPTFGKWVGYELSADNGRQLFIPKGFLHGFSTLKPNSELLYKCSDIYASDCDGTVKFDDPVLGIDWELEGVEPILSEKDLNAQSFATFDSPFIYEA